MPPSIIQDLIPSSLKKQRIPNSTEAIKGSKKQIDFSINQSPFFDLIRDISKESKSNPLSMKTVFEQKNSAEIQFKTSNSFLSPSTSKSKKIVQGRTHTQEHPRCSTALICPIKIFSEKNNFSLPSKTPNTTNLEERKSDFILKSGNPRNELDEIKISTSPINLIIPNNSPQNANQPKSTIVDPNLKTQLEKWIHQGKVQIFTDSFPHDSSNLENISSLKNQPSTLHPQLFNQPEGKSVHPSKGDTQDLNKNSLQYTPPTLFQPDQTSQMQNISQKNSLPNESVTLPPKEYLIKEKSDALVAKNLPPETIINVANDTPLISQETNAQNQNATPFPVFPLSFFSKEMRIDPKIITEELKINSVVGKQPLAENIKASTLSKQNFQTTLQETTLRDKIQLIQHLKAQLKEMFRTGETHLFIKLTPDRLGTIDLKLDIDQEGKVLALFKTDTQETLGVLRKYESEFRQIFKESGLTMDLGGMSFGYSQQKFDPSQNPISDHKLSKNDLSTTEMDDEQTISYKPPTVPLSSHQHINIEI